MDRKQMRGVRVSLSSQVCSRFRRTGSANLMPIESPTYFLAWEMVRSGHQDLWRENLICKMTELTWSTVHLLVEGHVISSS